MSFIFFILAGIAFAIGKAIAGFLWIIAVMAVAGLVSLIGRIFGRSE